MSDFRPGVPAPSPRASRPTAPEFTAPPPLRPVPAPASFVEREGEDAPRFLALGAGEHQRALIEAARSLEYRVTAVDRNPAAPGLERADQALNASITRPRGVLRRLIEQDPAAIPGSGEVNGTWAAAAARSYGPATWSAAILAARLGVPAECRNSVASLRFFRNKRRAKDWLSAVGVPTAPSLGFGQSGERMLFREMVAWEPLLARPASGHAKQGLRILRSAGEAEEFLARRPRDDSSWLVEPLIERRAEFTVLACVIQGRARVLFLSEKRVHGAQDGPPLFAEIAHVWPAPEAEARRDEIEAILQRIVERSGLRTGPLVAEFLLPVDSEELLLVEAMPETGGEFLADELLPAALPGLDRSSARTQYFQDLVRLYAGEPIDLDLYQNLYAGATDPNDDDDRAAVLRFVCPPAELHGQRLRSCTPPDELLEAPDLFFSRALLAPGEGLDLGRGNGARLAVFGLCGRRSQREQLEARAAQLAAEYAIETEESSAGDARP